MGSGHSAFLETLNSHKAEFTHIRNTFPFWRTATNKEYFYEVSKISLYPSVNPFHFADVRRLRAGADGNRHDSAHLWGHDRGLEHAAYLIRPDGTIVDTFSLPVHGMIQQEESATYLQVNVDLPVDFRYMMKIAEPNGDILIGKNF